MESTAELVVGAERVLTPALELTILLSCNVCMENSFKCHAVLEQFAFAMGEILSIVDTHPISENIRF
ncbi:hypothetical protein AYI68_g7624 [Smittium mucronatum]|uniref:Uncharacterized protein n=1 Tax=Smittium mucronatum TaxID=133383 RepID=A0A1R0GN73_9FUNG|nr:hypothetical protein AYI68_g7624 [Smittium mucronatum]